jgi:hypothetical protein
VVSFEREGQSFEEGMSRFGDGLPGEPMLTDIEVWASERRWGEKEEVASSTPNVQPRGGRSGFLSTLHQPTSVHHCNMANKGQKKKAKVKTTTPAKLATPRTLDDTALHHAISNAREFFLHRGLYNNDSAFDEHLEDQLDSNASYKFPTREDTSGYVLRAAIVQGLRERFKRVCVVRMREYAVLHSVVAFSCHGKLLDSLELSEIYTSRFHRHPAGDRKPNFAPRLRNADQQTNVLRH